MQIIAYYGFNSQSRSAENHNQDRLAGVGLRSLSGLDGLGAGSRKHRNSEREGTGERRNCICSSEQA
jgi:hypothetical protein